MDSIWENVNWSHTGIMGPNPSHKIRECVKRKAFYFYFYYNGFPLTFPTLKNILLGSYTDGYHFVRVTEQGGYLQQSKQNLMRKF